MIKNRSLKNIILQEDDTFLRPVDESAIDKGYLSWINNPDINGFLESRFKEWKKDDLIRYLSAVNSSENDFLFGIFYKEIYIGNIKIGPIDKNHSRASIGLIIGETAFQGKGHGLKAVNLIKHFGFDIIGIRKLTAGCYAENQASLNLFIKAGFLLEGTLPAHALYKKRECDVHMLGCKNPGWHERKA